MNPIVQKIDRQHILYDADLLKIADSAIFDAAALKSTGRLTGAARGRGSSYFFHYDDMDLVLRHYRRGGMVASLLGDRYINTGLARSRPWREFHLLARLRALDLPVPQPIAARFTSSLPFYRADIVIRQIASTQTLSARLSGRERADEIWPALGRMLARFHNAGVFHADLNAHNILLDQADGIYLIDFDRGRLLSSQQQGWKAGNLNRLRRSLDKLAALNPAFRFRHDDWLLLEAAYRNNSDT